MTSRVLRPVYGGANAVARRMKRLLRNQYDDRSNDVPPVADRAPPPSSTTSDEATEITRRLAHRGEVFHSDAHASHAALSALLRSCLSTTLDVASAASHASAAYSRSSVGEELLAWLPVVTSLRELADSLDLYTRSMAVHGDDEDCCVSAGKALVASGRARVICGGGGEKTSAGEKEKDRLVLQVFPTGLMESMVYAGWTGELWLHGDQREIACGIGTKKQQQEQQQQQRQKKKKKKKMQTSDQLVGKLGLVLGAGNYLPVVCLDILELLVIERMAVVCKMSPVNAYLGPFIRSAFAPFVEEGLLEIVYGDATIGAQLCTDALVAKVHLTGGVKTYDAIVWQGHDKTTWNHSDTNTNGIARDADAADASACVTPIGKPVAAELGCVTPCLVCPGKGWTHEDVVRQAKQIAANITKNAGHACLATEVILTSRSWEHRDAFLDALKAELNRYPCRSAYYPGSQEKFDRFKSRFPDAEACGVHGVHDDTNSIDDGSGFPRLPVLVQTGLTPTSASLHDENWCTVVQEIALDGDATAAEFLARAVHLCNTETFGTLSCSLYVHPKTQREESSAVDAAIASLEYGSVCINCPTLVGYGLTRLTWGAHVPGGTARDIGSGNCIVHNTLMVHGVQKSVVRLPWHIHPHPVWSLDHENLPSVASELLKFAAGPSVFGLMRVGWQAIRG